MMDFIEASQEKNEISLIITLDIKGAFNNANWRRIAEKIYELNIPKYLKNCLLSFITNRMVNCEHYHKDYNQGVPQGSSLGPKLWLILMNEILIKDYNHTVQAFADDICLMVRSKVVYHFNQLLLPFIDNIERWASYNKLNFSHDKCEFTLVRKGENIKTFPVVKIAGKRIKYRKYLKYLGIIIDHELTRIKHLDYIKEKILITAFKLGQLRKPTWGVRGHRMKECYISVIEKQILYGSEIWYTGSTRMINKLNGLQRIALLRITKCSSTVANCTLQVLAGVVPISIKAAYSKKWYKYKNSRTNFIIQNEVLFYEDMEETVKDEPP